MLLTMLCSSMYHIDEIDGIFFGSIKKKGLKTRICALENNRKRREDDFTFILKRITFNQSKRRYSCVSDLYNNLVKLLAWDDENALMFLQSKMIIISSH